MSKGPQISVVIRNRNNGRPLRRVLEALRRQSLPFELIVVDNDSADDSHALYEEYHARVVRIRREEFSYGKALNLGISAATTPFVLLLSAHSIPIGRRFLEDCLEPFQDPAVAAVMCLELDQAVEWLDEVRFQKPVGWVELVSANIGNRAAVIRRDVWTRWPFDERVAAAEDLLWCWGVVNLAGLTVVRGSALFQYAAARTWREQMRREHRERVALYQITKGAIRPDGSALRLLAPLWGTIPQRAIVDVIRVFARLMSVRAILRRGKGANNFQSK